MSVRQHAQRLGFLLRIWLQSLCDRLYPKFVSPSMAIIMAQNANQCDYFCIDWLHELEGFNEVITPYTHRTWKFQLRFLYALEIGQYLCNQCVYGIISPPWAQNANQGNDLKMICQG